MAASYSCDCCGAAIQGKPVEFGLALVRQYCAACAPDIQVFMERLDALHTQVAAAYREGKARSVDAFGEAHPGCADIKLPDVP